MCLLDSKTTRALLSGIFQKEQQVDFEVATYKSTEPADNCGGSRANKISDRAVHVSCSCIRISAESLHTKYGVYNERYTVELNRDLWKKRCGII